LAVQVKVASRAEQREEKIIKKIRQKLSNGRGGKRICSITPFKRWLLKVSLNEKILYAVGEGSQCHVVVCVSPYGGE
jgi:hypothetical protein